MDIVITIPKTVSWVDYQKELKAVEDGSQVINFKVPHLPKNTEIGDRCYICYVEAIIGWMEIVGLKSGGFTCTTTGKYWEGNFIQRSGKFNKVNHILMKGFQGFRYYNGQ